MGESCLIGKVGAGEFLGMDGRDNNGGLFVEISKAVV